MSSQHVFLDDNIERHRAHIVDARDVHTGEALDFKGCTQGVHLVHVEPLEAILDVDYYVKTVQAAEAAFDRRWAEKDAGR
jgi:hypothetical protein